MDPSNGNKCCKLSCNCPGQGHLLRIFQFIGCADHHGTDNGIGAGIEDRAVEAGKIVTPGLGFFDCCVYFNSTAGIGSFFRNGIAGNGGSINAGNSEIYAGRI